jgi:hypothetical protein
MTNPRQNVISKLDSRLEHFLKAYAVKRLDQLKVSDKINSLREITFSNKEQYRQMDNRLAELESWFKENEGLLSGKTLTKEMIHQLEECVDQIGAYSRGEFGYPDKQAVLFNRKQAAGVAATANLFVNRIAGVLAESGAHLVTSPVKPPEIDLTEPKSAESGVDNREIMDQLKNSIDYQSKMLDYYQQTGQHPFTAVDSLLKALEKSPDLKGNHLAASMLYFMKLKGYKVGPYVERLRKVGNRKNG